MSFKAQVYNKSGCPKRLLGAALFVRNINDELSLDCF
jgi:hypothetical protein